MLSLCHGILPKVVSALNRGGGGDKVCFVNNFVILAGMVSRVCPVDINLFPVDIDRFEKDCAAPS
jgi:hypothetical protein